MEHWCILEWQVWKTRNIYEGSALDNNGKRKYVDQVIADFLEEHVVYNVPELSDTAPTSNDLIHILPLAIVIKCRSFIDIS